MTGRHVRVGINEAPDPAADINLAQMGIRERIMRWLFGPMNELTVIVLGHRVHDVSLTRRPTDLPDEETAALEAAVQRHPAGSKLHRVGGDAA